MPVADSAFWVSVQYPAHVETSQHGEYGSWFQGIFLRCILEGDNRAGPDRVLKAYGVKR